MYKEMLQVMLAVLLAVVLAMHGTATKLQTARKINGTNFDGSGDITTSKWGTARTLALSGAVSGSASVDGSGNVTITTKQANIAVLTGSATAEGSTTEIINYATADINYPSGFNRNNCIVLAFALTTSNSNVGDNYNGFLARLNIDNNFYLIGSSIDSVRYSQSRSINLTDSAISIRIMNVTNSSKTFNYKIVLMKIS